MARIRGILTEQPSTPYDLWLDNGVLKYCSERGLWEPIKADLIAALDINTYPMEETNELPIPPVEEDTVVEEDKTSSK